MLSVVCCVLCVVCCVLCVAWCARCVVFSFVFAITTAITLQVLCLAAQHLMLPLTGQELPMVLVLPLAAQELAH